MRDGKAWVKAAYISDIPLREGRAVQVASREIAIFNLGDRFLAIENRCPHRGGPLADGIGSGSAVVCPLHAWKFNLDSGKGVSAASQLSCVRTFPTRVERGVVLVEMNLESLDGDDSRVESLPSFCGSIAPTRDSAASGNSL
jgi:nitrite reductase (NADH) small subunit